MPTDHHADHVGSLLRPLWLLEARSEHKQGRLAAGQLRELQDRAALEAIELQRVSCAGRPAGLASSGRARRRLGCSSPGH